MRSAVITGAVVLWWPVARATCATTGAAVRRAMVARVATWTTHGVS